MTHERHVVFGCNGTVGRGLLEQIVAAGHEAVAVARSGMPDPPAGVTVERADAADRDRAAQVSRGADVIHVAIGIPYPQWAERFPPVLEGVLHAAKVSGARFVWTDNLYCYGPRDEPLREDMAPTHHGRKPALRARMVERMLEAHERGDTRVAIVRASDFIGPRAHQAMLGDPFFPRVLKGKAAQFLGDPDLPHTYTHVPDLVRAQMRIAADEDAFGRAWHVPNPPTRTTRAIMNDVFARIGREPKIQTMPGWMLRIAGLFDPTMRELHELLYQWKRPFVVDDSDFRSRYDLGATAWDEILDTTLDYFRRVEAAEGKR